MTLEAEVGAIDEVKSAANVFPPYSGSSGSGLRVILLLYVLHCASALNTAYAKACRVVEAADNSCLPFQWTLHCLVKLRRLVEVYNIDPALSRTNDQHLIPDTHGIDTILAVQGSCRRLLSEVPVLDSLVPRSSHQHMVALDQYALDTSDWLIVSCDLLCCSRV